MRARALLRGVLSYVPGFNSFIGRRRVGGATGSPRYCYSVWLRHLSMAHVGGLNTNPATVAELGPGDSVGVGLAALLSGSERYWALDVASYTDAKKNLDIFEGLVDLFAQRAAIPNDDELLDIQPTLDSYAFPSHILTSQRLEAALDPTRLERLRAAIKSLGSPGSPASDVLSYLVSWQAVGRIQEGSVDAILSQAVLEHVDDLEGTYGAMRAWLRPGGYMTHQIDFRSHGTTSGWNGHWTVGDLPWRIARGRREYFLNRTPCSRHISVVTDLGFRVVHVHRQLETSAIERHALAPRFRSISEEDLRTRGVFLQAAKTP